MKPSATQLRMDAIEGRLTKIEDLFSRLNALVTTIISREKERNQGPAISQKEATGERWDQLLKGSHG